MFNKNIKPRGGFCSGAHNPRPSVCFPLLCSPSSLHPVKPSNPQTVPSWERERESTLGTAVGWAGGGGNERTNRDEVGKSKPQNLESLSRVRQSEMAELMMATMVSDWRKTDAYRRPFWLDLAAATATEAKAEHRAADTPNPETLARNETWIYLISPVSGSFSLDWGGWSVILTYY